MEFVDIGANLLDDKYQGIYYNKERHAPDLQEVLDRALTKTEGNSVVSKLIITGGTLKESEEALELVQSLQTAYPHRLFSTVGVHPTRCSQEFGNDDNWDADGKLEKLLELARRGKDEGTVVAMGELGLDYARTEFCPVEIQKRGCVAQLKIAQEVGLPLFLHNRETGTDLLDILKDHVDDTCTGVVHSFDDTLELAQQFMDLGFYIGINGCSLKQPHNLEVVQALPLYRLLLETDCPWCDIKPTHVGHSHIQTTFPTKPEKKYMPGHCVKGRYEPCHIIQVAEVIAAIKGVSVQEVAKASTDNAHKLFNLHSK